MTISAVAFVPAAPLLVSQVAGGSVGLDEALRAASLDVIARSLPDRPAGVTVVASTATAGEWPPEATWDFAGFGVPREMPDGRPGLPWPLGVGAWLLDEVGWDGPRRYLGVTADDTAVTTADDADAGGPTVIAVGDGSACRTERAPGYLDERADAFDTEIADLLARGDATGLGAIDAGLAAELMCAGLPVWRWVSAAVGAADVSRSELVTHVAPYGVGYFVARWSIS